MKKTVITLAAAALLLGACAESGYGTKQTAGGLIGAAGGGLLGSQFGSGKGALAATAAGVLLGAFLGSEVGKSMDEVDRQRAQQAMRSAQTAPVGQPIVWNNPNTGNSGQVVAVRDGTDARTGAYCREFQETVTIGGKPEQAYGTACRQPDGSWKVTR
jgi:surface antigen